MDLAPQKLRINPGKSAFYNLAEVTANGDWEVTFHLKRPQPAFPMLIAGDSSGIYPCHVSPAQMRQHPIGTGPFKFVEYKPNEDIKVARNPDYWNRDGLISTASNIQSSKTWRLRIWRSSPGSSTSPFRSQV